MSVPDHRFSSFADILDALRSLERQAQDARALSPSVDETANLNELIDWLQGHLRRFEDVQRKLESIPGAADIIQDWFAHEPAQNAQPAPLGSKVVALLAQSVALEDELLRLIGALLQDSDGPWVRELYGQLLDNPGPAQALVRRVRAQTTDSARCPSPSQ